MNFWRALFIQVFSISPLLNAFLLFAELVEEILVRLPARQLYKFKIVCKFWFEKICDLDVWRYLRISKSRDSHPYLFSLSKDDSEQLFCVLDSQSGNAYPINSLSQPTFQAIEINQTVQGLTCFDLRGQTILVNITTGELVSFPTPSVEPYPPSQSKTFIGLDEEVGAVKILKKWVFLEPEFQVKDMILTLGSDSEVWSTIEDSNPTDYLWGDIVTINRQLYFLGSDRDQLRYIVALDLHTEKFNKVIIPKTILPRLERFTLIQFDGSFAMAEVSNTTIQLHILDQSVGKIWIQKTIQVPDSLMWINPKMDGFEPQLQLRVSSGFRELLICPVYATESYFVLFYHLEKKQWKKIKINRIPPDFLAEYTFIGRLPLCYIENLMSCTNLSALGIHIKVWCCCNVFFSIHVVIEN